MRDSHPLAQWIDNNATRADFARDVKCSISHLNNILARRKRPSLDLLDRMSERTDGMIGAEAFKYREAAE